MTQEATHTTTTDPKEPSLSVPLEMAAKNLCDAAIAMVKKSEEMFVSKDFRTVFAIAQAQGYVYQGPMIQDAAKDLIAAIQEFQKLIKNP